MQSESRPSLPDDILEQINGNLGGLNELIGLRFTKAALDELRAQVEVGPHLHQPYGLVHGGVYAAMVETVASTGAALHALADGRTVVGLENATSFLRAHRGGTLYARGIPLVTGRRSHVWEVGIRDENDRLLATGKVRLLCLVAGTAVAGADLQPGLKSSGT